MISKERLEELIKEGATIWVKNDYQTYEINTSYFVNIDIIDNILYCGAEMVHLDYLYETKKQAEWHLKYHATRTEELDLPTWKEAEKGIEYNVYALKGCIYRLKTKIKTGYSCDKENPYIIRIEKVGYANSQLDFEFNEENYIKACDLCLKLFKGEYE